MPAIDSCQPQVIRALQKAGWTIATKTTALQATSDMPIFIDIEAFKLDARIYVEVKCFPAANRSQELHIAFGQYVIYREVIARLRPDSVLYLAVPYDNPDLASPVFQATIRNNRVKIILIDLKAEEIVQWKE